MIKIIGATGKIDPDTALKAVEKLSAKWKLEIALFNADLVFGTEHLVSAYDHANRAFKSRTNIAKTLATEMLLYASGLRQISKAIEKIGIRKGTKKVAVAFLGEPTRAQISTLLSDLSLNRNDEVLMPEEKNLQAFGISKTELNAVPKEKRARLVLEKVAFVDLLK
jgi:KEOPS complex subunit Cgi121